MRATPPAVTVATLALSPLAAPLAGEARPAGKVYQIAMVFTATPVAEMTESADPGFARSSASCGGSGQPQGRESPRLTIPQSVLLRADGTIE